MINRAFCAISLFVVLCGGQVAVVAGERLEFSTKDGESIKGELIGAYNGIAYIDNGRGRSFMLRYDELDETGRGVVNEWFKSYLAAKAKGPAKVGESDSKLTSFLADKLQILRDGSIADYEFSSKPEPEFYGFYFSAHWCGPCRRFTPKLRAFYNGMKAIGHDDFEIVFVSSDTSNRMMQQYMMEDAMPWPAIKYNKRSHGLVSKYKGNGIPCLVITDKYGNLLAHSYAGDEYLGPDLPKSHLESLLTYTAALERKLAAARKD